MKGGVILVAAAISLSGCAFRRHMPIDDLPVLDHSRPDMTPEQLGYANLEPKPEASTGPKAVYGPGNPARLDSWEAQPSSPVPTGDDSALRPLEFDRRAANTSADSKRQQRVDDSKALLLEQWESYRLAIEMLSLGERCGVVEAPLVNVALARLLNTMTIEAMGPDTVGAGIDARAYLTRARESGAEAAASGACTKLAPTTRARIRNLAIQLLGP